MHYVFFETTVEVAADNLCLLISGLWMLDKGDSTCFYALEVFKRAWSLRA